MTSQTTDYAQRWPDKMAVNEHEKPQDKMEQRFTSVNNPYLWTPPEQNADSFSQEIEQERPQEWQQTTKLPPLQAQTPPTSPAERSLPSISHATGYASHDEQLYPEQGAERAHSQTPLFGADRSPSVPSAPSPPRGEDVGQDMLSKLILGSVTSRAAASKYTSSEHFPSNLGIRTGREALMYYYSRVGELKAYQSARRTTRLPPPTKTRSPERDEFTKDQLHRIEGSRVGKPRPQPKPATKARAASASAATSPVQRTPQPRKRTPKARTLSDFHNEAFPSQEKKHKRAAPSKKTEDTRHWSEMEDYAPSISTLETNGKALKAYWQGNNLLDLSADPERHSLHPQELGVASTLRLTCAQYMTNKRKIFKAGLEARREGKTFTKTAAQGACSIDVNKASQLHIAFDRVGWLEPSWFDQWL